MVWHEIGKYGVHNGRTLRSPLKPPRASPYSRAGYITKVVVNKTDQLETGDIKKHLKNFSIDDGFDDDFVVAESHQRGFDPDNEWGRGYQSYDAVLSLNKKKRWLLPQLVREKLTEDQEIFEGEDVFDPRVVLFERKSANSQDYESSLKRLKRGDCFGVVDSSAKDSSSWMEKTKKRKKLYHVGDKYKRSLGTEINYEVCQSISANSWPNFKETRSNHERFNFWYGDFRERGKKSKKSTEMIKYCLSDVDDMKDDYVDYDDDEILMTQCGSKDRSCEIDLDAYVTKALNRNKIKACQEIGRKSRKFHRETKSNPKLMENLNPASSEAISCYGKGNATMIDNQEKTNTNNDDIDASIIPNTPPTSMAQSTMESNTVIKQFKLSVLIDSLVADNLQDRFKSRFKEGESIPRKFFIAAPFCHHQYLLFVPYFDKETKQDMSCEVVVTLVYDDGQNTSGESGSDAFTNSCDRLAQLESQKMHLSIHEVVDIFDNSCTCCVESKGRCDPKKESFKIRKTVLAYDVLNSFTGHKTEVHSLVEATKEISSASGQRLLDETATKTYDSHHYFNCAEYTKTCEICYTDSNDISEGFTALLACNHWFCNDCWRMHLVAQLQLGKTKVSCPAMKCSEVVDDVTFMSLAPKSHFRYKNMQHDVAFEMNHQWNWCPSNKCQLVTKVTVTRGHKTPRDEAEAKQATPLPCMCTCSQVWCFSCQEEPHWPASCEQARRFRQQTKKYQEIIATSGDDRVTSVSVRHCPKCKYPIEKDGGCPHMSCPKCHGDFCWKCLNVWSWGPHECKDGVVSEEIELTDTIGNTRFNKHVRISTIHKKARKVEHLFKMYKQVEDISNAVTTHHKHIQHKLLNLKLPSKTQGFLALCHTHNIPEKLRLMVDTKFISHSVIEGVSIHMATSKTKHGHQVLRRLTNNLHFVIVRLEHYLDMKLEDLCLAIDQAMTLVETAKAIIVDIGQFTRDILSQTLKNS